MTLHWPSRYLYSVKKKIQLGKDFEIRKGENHVENVFESDSAVALAIARDIRLDSQWRLSC